MRLREQARSVCGKLLVMADAEMNETNENNDKLKPLVKSQDLRLANVQQTVVKATITLAEATEKISKVKGKMDEKPKIISSLTDSLTLLGHATYELLLWQRGYYETLNKQGTSCPLQSTNPSNGFPLWR